MKIGVVLPIAEGDGEAPRYPEIRSLAKQAEQAGFDSIWVYDHLIYRFPERPVSGLWESWTLMTALAEATERVEIGSIVLCLPFRPPALTAKMADTLEEVSGGRLILGLGAGWHEPEFTAFGYPFDHLGSRFEEGIKIIAHLLREGRVDFEGEYYQAKECELRPRGPRAGGPPILVAGSKPRMLRLTAQYANAWNTAWLGRSDKLADRVAKLHAACAEVDRDPAEIEITVGITVSYDDAGDEPIDPDRVLTGTAQEIAVELKRYADQNVGHAICNVSPTNSEDFAKFAEAVAEYRNI